MNTTSGIIFEKDKKTGKRYVCVDIEQYQEEICCIAYKRNRQTTA
jgi:hypothetical protein